MSLSFLPSRSVFSNTDLLKKSGSASRLGLFEVRPDRCHGSRRIGREPCDCGEKAKQSAALINRDLGCRLFLVSAHNPKQQQEKDIRRLACKLEGQYRRQCVLAIGERGGVGQNSASIVENLGRIVPDEGRQACPEFLIMHQSAELHDGRTGRWTGFFSLLHLRHHQACCKHD